MAKKSRPSFLKRQREQKKSEKAQLKREKQLERRRQADGLGEPGLASEDPDGAPATGELAAPDPPE